MTGWSVDRSSHGAGIHGGAFATGLQVQDRPLSSLVLPRLVMAMFFPSGSEKPPPFA